MAPGPYQPLAARCRMNENYDLEGRVHKLEQRRPITSGLESLPDHDSFDVEFSPSGQAIHFTQYTFAGQVFRSETYNYDDLGRLVRTLEFDGADTEASKTDYECDSGGKRVGWTRRDKSGAVTVRSAQEYLGRLVASLVSFRANVLVMRRKTFDYSEDKLAQSVSTYYNPTGDVTEQCISRYNAEERIAETFGLRSDGKPLGDGRYEYEYDLEGRESRVLSFNDSADGNEPNHIKHFAYKFDKHGNWIERCEYSRFTRDSDWQKSVTTRKLIYYLPRT